VPVSVTVGLVIVTALAFDFTNGFHDTANAMATSIATGALRPKVAVLISGALNLVGAFVSTKVARTISSGIVDDRSITPAIVFAGLVGAILWNLVTWFLGLPSSSSHALFGGLIGAVWVGAGEHAVHFDQVLSKVLIPAPASPLIAGVAATIATWAAYRLISCVVREFAPASGSRWSHRRTHRPDHLRIPGRPAHRPDEPRRTVMTTSSIDTVLTGSGTSKTGERHVGRVAGRSRVQRRLPGASALAGRAGARPARVDPAGGDIDSAPATSSSGRFSAGTPSTSWTRPPAIIRAAPSRYPIISLPGSGWALSISAP
jgi:phosphate/sulfate permease